MLYIIRHGQTDWNAELRLQGQQDIALNDTGRIQAARNGKKLSQLIADPQGFDFVSSPLGRTRETMEIIRGEMGVDPKAYRNENRIIEISFGDWEGFTFEELRVENNEAVDRRFADKWNFVQPNGESYQILCDRVEGWLDAVNQDTVIVCHGGVIRAFLRLLQDLPAKEAAELPVPQDRIFVWHGGMGEWV